MYTSILNPIQNVGATLRARRGGNAATAVSLSGYRRSGPVALRARHADKPQRENSKMSYCLDVESFISEIKKHPEIWDLTCEDNRHKMRKQRAWSEVARLFIEDFDGMSEVDKIDVREYGVHLIRSLRFTVSS